MATDDGANVMSNPVALATAPRRLQVRDIEASAARVRAHVKAMFLDLTPEERIALEKRFEEKL